MKISKEVGFPYRTEYPKGMEEKPIVKLNLSGDQLITVQKRINLIIILNVNKKLINLYIFIYF